MNNQGIAKESLFSRPWGHRWREFLARIRGQFVSMEATTGSEAKYSLSHTRVPIFFLFAFPLAILVGPRISLPYFDQGDFRIQDFLVVGAILYFMGLDFSRASKRAFHGSSILLWVLVLSAWVVATHAIVNVDFTIGTAYTLRLLEIPVLSVIIFRSLELAGDGKQIFVLGSIALGTALNLIWIAVQLVTGSKRVFWSVASGGIAQYGPGLVGEPGAFPAGQTLVILLAGAVSVQLSPLLQRRQPVVLSTFLVAGIYGSILLTQSRMSLGVGSLIVAFWLLMVLGRLRRRNPLLAQAIGVSFILATALMLPLLPRVGWHSIVAGTEFRWVNIYTPMLQLLEENFFLGLSVGAGRDARSGNEYHSLYVAILSDFGFVGFVIFCITTVLLIRNILTRLADSPRTVVRFFALWSLFIILNLLAAGILQSSHMSATPTHLAAVIIATYFWLIRAGKNLPGPLLENVSARGRGSTTRLKFGSPRETSAS
jgi:hypothetical protein